MIRHAVCRSALVALVVGAFSPELSAQPSRETNSGFAELQSRIEALQTAGDPQGTVPQLVEAWLQTRDVNRLGVEETQWCLRYLLPSRQDRRSFSVTWTGLLTPARTGNYVFSVSPINVNRQFGGDIVRHTISVAIADTKVVDAGPKKVGAKGPSRDRSVSAGAPAADEWQWKGAPVDLQANRPVPIRVEMEYECREPSFADSPSAIVSWEGPGVARQPIPNSALKLPDQSGDGLRAEYRFPGEQQPVVVQNSPSIEYAWTTPASVASRNPESVIRLTQHLWKLCTAEEFLAQCTAGEAVHPYSQDESSSEHLTGIQRRQFAQLLKDTPDLLSRVADEQLLRLYRQFRFGAEDEALDMLGHWMQLHAGITPEITADFFRENRQVYAELADHISRQLPEHYVTLQEDYLEMPDGRCCLPVAYTLAYSYRNLPVTLDMEASRPEMPSNEWIELLDNKLADESLPGNIRVNWLLARAQTAEAQTCSPRLAAKRLATENCLAGTEWLTEANLVVDDDATRQRLYHEEIARLAAMRRDAEVNQVLASAAGSVPAQELESWQRDSAAVATYWQKRRANDRRLVRDAYVKSIARRRKGAASRGDELSVARYDQILKKYDDQPSD